MKLKVCFIGVGSIAKRHIKNLYKICMKRQYRLQIDVFRHSASSIAIEDDIAKLVSNIYISMNELPDDYDIIFITNPTEMHAETLYAVHDKSTHFFIEKPVASIDNMQEMMNFREKEGSLYYVACPLRYNAVIQYIKHDINLSEVLAVRSISTSYLPAWRPSCDYRDTYSAHRAMGGGVGIDLIHEWDYLTYLFGQPEKCHCFIGKVSDLEIDSDDFAIYIAAYQNMTVELHLDYYGRESIREVMLIMKDDTVIGDLVHNKITFLKKKRQIDFGEVRNDYQIREIEHFLNMIVGEERQDQSDIGHALNVLRLTQGSV